MKPLRTFLLLLLASNLGQPFAYANSPFFQSGLDGHFEGAKKVSIHYRIWDQPSTEERGAIVFLPGRGDPYEIYEDTLQELWEAGYSIYAMDHRGQGASNRFLSDSQKDHVDRFGRFVEDVKKFVDETVNARPHAKRFLLAHSMGGAVSAMYLTKHHEDFTAAALVTPMLRIITRPYTFKKALALTGALMGSFQHEHYAPNRGPFDPDATFSPDNTLTSSEPRWTAMMDVLRAKPRIQVGGPTVQWVYEALKAGFKTVKRGDRVRTPIRIFMAGNDEVVENEQQKEFCDKAPGCELAPVLAHSKHMLLSEADEFRTPTMQDILAYFARF